jgi:hypothetical protein
VPDNSVRLVLSTVGASSVLASLKSMASATEDVGDEASEAGSKASGSFSAMAKDAAAAAAAIGGILGAAYGEVSKAIDKFNTFNDSIIQVQGALGLTRAQTDQLRAQLRQLGAGELASIPGVFDEISEAASGYLQSGGDLTHLNTDLGAAFKFARVNGEDYQETVANLMGVTDSWNIENGQAINTLNVLKQVQLGTNKELGALFKGLERSASMGTVYNFTFEEMAAVTAGWASTGERASTMSSALLTIMDSLSLDSLPALLDTLDDVNAGIIDLGELSAQDQKYLGALAGQVDQIRGTYARLGEQQDILSRSWDRINRETMSETVRQQNEVEAALLQTGERMQELQPKIEMFKTGIQLTALELAEWALKNPEYVAAIVMGLLTIKTVFMALKASNPFGLIIAGVELLIGGVIALTDWLVQTDEETRDLIRANKQMLESQRADIDATRAQIRAKEGLTEKYQDLTALSYRLTASIREQAVAEARLTAAIEAKNAANEAGTARHEDNLAREFQAYQESIRSLEDIEETQSNITEATQDLVAALNDEEKLHELARKILIEMMGIDEARADLMLENIDSQEEVNALIGVMSSGMEAAQVLQDESLAALNHEVRLMYDQAGILDDILAIKDGTASLTEAEARATRAKAVAQHNLLIDLWGELETRKATLEAWKAQGMIADQLADGAIGKIDEAMERVDRAIYQSTQGLVELTGYIGAIGRDETDGGGGGGGGAGDGETEEARQGREAEADLAEMRMQKMKAAAVIFTELMFDGEKRLNEIKVENARKLAEETMTRQVRAYRRIAAVATDAFSGGWKQAIGKLIEDLAKQIASNIIVWAFLSIFNPAAAGGFVSSAFGGTLIGDLFGFAQGGIVRKPTAALIGEGGEPEYIAPASLIQRKAAEVGPALAGSAAIAELEGRPFSAAPLALTAAAPVVNIQIPPAQVRVVQSPRGTFSQVSYAGRIEQLEEGR